MDTDHETERIHKRITNAMKKRGMPYEATSMIQLHNHITSAGDSVVMVGQTYHEDDYDNRFFIGYFPSLVEAEAYEKAAWESPCPRFIQSITLLRRG